MLEEQPSLSNIAFFSPDMPVNKWSSPYSQPAVHSFHAKTGMINGSATTIPSSNHILYESGLSRKRARQYSDTSSGSDGVVQWEYHPVYGIIHSSLCNICSAYTAHLAGTHNQLSYQAALESLNASYDIYFYDGVTEGRRRQRDEDAHIHAQLDRSNKELQDAVAALAEYKKEMQATQNKPSQVESDLSGVQLERDGLQHNNHQLVMTQASDQNDVCSRIEAIEAQQDRIHPDSISDGLLYEESPTPSTLDCMEYVITIPPTMPSLDHEPATSNVPLTYAAIASINPTNSSLSPSPIRQNVLSARSHLALLPAKPNIILPELSPKDRPSHATSHRNPKNLSQLQALMRLAHKPANDGALAKVKAMCAEAHSMPRDRKTELQRYLLSNWRNPVPQSSLPPSVPSSPFELKTQVAKTNPRIDDPIEVWYDYYCTHQGSWPRGVRQDAFTRPVMSDLKASRAVARLRPEISRRVDGAEIHMVEGHSSRTIFMEIVANLFSQPGLYQQRVETLGLTVSPTVSFKPYTEPIPITMNSIIRHFAECGVGFDEATQDLEPWAPQYKLDAHGSAQRLNFLGVGNHNGRQRYLQ